MAVTKAFKAATIFVIFIAHGFSNEWLQLAKILEDGYINYVKGANIAGFMKVANAMVEQGLV